MTSLRILMYRLRAVLLGGKLDQDLDDEIGSHLDFAARENELRGMSPEQARAEALRQFGGVQRIKALYRERRGLPLLESILQDLRYALRTYRRSPGFTFIVLLTLALGIGANTAIFSLIDVVMLRPLPVQDPGRLVQLARVGPGGTITSFSFSDFERFRDANSVLSDALASSTMGRIEAIIDGQVDAVQAELVSGNFFSALGVSPYIGRDFGADDDHGLGESAVAVISYGYWNRRFGLDPSIVGKSIALHGRPFTVTGVTPQSFLGMSVGSSPDIYLPLAMEPSLRDGKSWLPEQSFHWLQVVARLKPSVSRAEALSDLNVIWGRIIAETPMDKWAAKDRENFLAQKPALVSAASGLLGLRKRFSEPLLILMAMVGLVLLIACANVANLMVARATSRQREIAVRLAIGAGRLRLVRQLIIESLVLAVGGGALGLLLAYFSGGAMVALMSIGAPLMLDMHPDIRVLLFTGVVSMIAAILFGLAPALGATHVALPPTLKQNAGGAGSTGFRLSQRRALLIAQVAFSLLLICGAGLLVRTLVNLEGVDLGFDRNNVLVFSIDAKKTGYKGSALANLYRQVLERLAAIPGVRSASVSLMLPVTGGGGWDNGVDVEGHVPRPDEDMRLYLNALGPSYFRTLGTRMLAGREFELRDNENSPRVAVVNQAMANYFFADRSAVGKKFGWGDGGDREEFEIIGVVQDSKYETLREEVPRSAYVNCFQRELGPMEFEVRTEVKPSAIIQAVRSRISALGETIRADGFSSLHEQVENSLSQERLMMTLSSLFASLGLLLTSIGLYGVMAYAVAVRTGEIGIRMALGARSADVLWMVQRETLLMVLAGAAIGVPAAVAASSFISGVLFGVKPSDPLTMAGATMLMLAVGALAAYFPARRASRLDPMQALRYE
jgi:predicted permease